MAEALKTVAGLAAVMVGLAAVCVVAVVAMPLVSDSQNVVAIATGSFGVIGTMVGAYFGVKLGSDSTQRAVQGMQEEAAKAQAFAAYLPSDDADKAIERAGQLLAPTNGTEAPRSSA